MSRSPFKGFQPKSIPEVKAGYYWDPLMASGAGTSSFLIPEANGKTAYNMITPATNTSPTAGILNNRSILTYTNGTPDDLARTNTTVQRGWTGATMVWGWISGNGGSVFGHWRTVNNLLVVVSSTRTDIHAHDGSAVNEYRFPAISGPAYIEVLFVPSESATNRIQLYVNRVQQTPTVAPSFGSTSLLDTAEYINFCGHVGDNSTFNIGANAIFGVFGMTNGIPKESNRDRLYNYRRLA